MPEPTDGLPTWATDGGTTLQPSSGQKAAGWSAGQRPPARWQNWWQNLVYQWTAWLRGEPNGLMVWSGYLYSSDPAEVAVGPIASLRINGKQLSSATELILDTSAIVDDGVFYVYAFDDSGTISLLGSDTPPDSTLTFQDGNTFLRYIGTFFTDEDGHVVPFRAHRGRYIFRVSQFDTEQGVMSLLGGASTSTYTTNTVVLMPPHARIAILRCEYDLTGETPTSDATAAGVRTKGDTAAAHLFEAADLGGNRDGIVLEIETNEDLEIEARVGVSDPDGTPDDVGLLIISSIGFVE